MITKRKNQYSGTPETKREVFKVLTAYDKQSTDAIRTYCDSNAELIEGASEHPLFPEEPELARALVNTRQHQLPREFWQHLYPLGVQFLWFIQPMTTLPSYTHYSESIKGSYFKPHRDDPMLGQFAATIFLSDPDEYGGGELELLIDGKPKRFKLPKGEAVIYEADTPHQVRQTTGGKRRVINAWFISKFNNKEQLYRYRSVQEYLLKNQSKIYPVNQEDITNSLRRFTTKPFQKDLEELHHIVRWLG